MNNLKMDFLNVEQCVGNEKLKIFKRYDLGASISDFAILLGGHVDEGYGDWWTKSHSMNGDSDTRIKCRVTSHFFDEEMLFFGSTSEDIDNRTTGGRPFVYYHLIKDQILNEENLDIGLKRCEYGEYPDDVVKRKLARILESKFLNNELKKTGKKYTTDGIKLDAYDTSFRASEFVEYEYNGRKYIRFVGDKNCVGKELSNRRKVRLNKSYWIEVKPIKLLVDIKNDIALCEKIVFAGVQFDQPNKEKEEFENSNIYNFMNTYFVKDIIPAKLNNQIQTVEVKSEEEKLLILIKNEFKTINDKINQINDLSIKQTFSDQLRNIFDEIKSFINEKRINEETHRLHFNQMYSIKKQAIAKLWKINFFIDECLEKEKIINEIILFANQIITFLNIDIIDISTIKSIKFNALKSIHLLYSEINKVLEKLNGIESKIILEKLNILSNKFIRIINDNLEKDKNGTMLVLDYEGLNQIIVRDFIKFNIIVDEYISNKKNYDRQDELLDEIEKSLIKR